MAHMSGTQLCQAGLSPLDKYAGRRHTCQCTASLSGSTMRSVRQSGLGMMLGSSSRVLSISWDPCANLLLGSQASKGSYPYHHYEHCRVWLRLPPRSQGCVQHSTEQPSLRLAYSLSHTWAIALVLISRREHALQEATCSCSGPLHLCPFFQKQVYVLASSLLSWPGTLSRKP